MCSWCRIDGGRVTGVCGRGRGGRTPDRHGRSLRRRRPEGVDGRADLRVDEADLVEQLLPVGEGEPAGDAVGPQLGVGDRFGGNGRAEGDVGERDGAGGVVAELGRKHVARVEVEAGPRVGCDGPVLVADQRPQPLGLHGELVGVRHRVLRSSRGFEEDGRDQGGWRRRGFPPQIERFEAVEQAVLEGEPRGRRPRGRTGLGVDALDVGLGRLGGDGQSLSGLAGRRAPGDEGQDLDLPPGQPGRSRAPLARVLAGGRQHGSHRVGVEPAGADSGPQLDSGPLGGHGRSVRARFGHGPERARGRQHPGRDGDRRTGEAAVIAGAVAALPDQRGDGTDPGEGGRAGQHALGVVRVHAHPFPFRRRQRARLVQDRRGDAVHADVVQQRRSPHVGDVRLRAAGLGRGPPGEACDTPGVTRP